MNWSIHSKDSVTGHPKASNGTVGLDRDAFLVPSTRLSGKWMGLNSMDIHKSACHYLGISIWFCLEAAPLCGHSNYHVPAAIIVIVLIHLLITLFS